MFNYTSKFTEVVDAIRVIVTMLAHGLPQSRSLSLHVISAISWLASVLRCGDDLSSAS
jgi:hypothetical protein